MKTFEYATSSGTVARWQDPKRYLWLLGLIVPALPFLAAGLHAATGATVTLFLGPIIFFVIVPLVDLVAGTDPSNPPEELVGALEGDRWYRAVLYAYLPLQYVGFVYGMWLIADGGLTTVGRIGMALTLGTVSGVAINTAHELGHKRDETERWLGKIALAQCFYGHFYIEHNRGHHVRVSTPEDPASARIGESFWRFWPRTVGGSLKSAWQAERKRIGRRGRHPFRLGNDVLNAWLMSVVLWAVLIAWLGPVSIPFLVLQAVYGFSLLEAVNYTEHYGMLRQPVMHGDKKRFERVDPSHSWNSNNIATNVLLYHLQRHSDHHANPTRRFQTLRDFPESPVLPTGYTGMILLCYVPPLFRRAMDHRVVEHFHGDLRLANVQPGKLDALLAKWPLPVDLVAHEAKLSAEALAAAADGVGSVDAARCPGCGYTYVVAEGNEAEGFAAGTPWSQLPDDWTCPDCGVRDKVDFVVLAAEAA